MKPSSRTTRLVRATGGLIVPESPHDDFDIGEQPADRACNSQRRRDRIAFSSGRLRSRNHIPGIPVPAQAPVRCGDRVRIERVDGAGAAQPTALPPRSQGIRELENERLQTAWRHSLNDVKGSSRQIGILLLATPFRNRRASANWLKAAKTELIATFLLQIANADLRFATICAVSPGEGMARTWDRQWFRPSGPVDAPRIAAAGEVGPPSRQIVEVMRAAQQQGVAERPLRWPWALSIAPFSCDMPGLLRVGVKP